ncbi:MAG: VWA domain-containing protein [Fusobacteriaceae bacterium]|jgi:Ca-activated chloride channel family protein|nr:VWA domain-containing protein [Fusobacteriaceae bacterium]
MEFGNMRYAPFLLIPLLILAIMLAGFGKKRRLLRQLTITGTPGLELLRIVLMTAGAFALVLALLSPQRLLDEEKQDVKGADIYALIDVSRSMMTEDVYPNRLEGAKRLLTVLLKNLKGDRIGFIPFSDSAYIQMPLTDDYAIGKNYIDAIDGNLISGGGTELYQGLQIADNSFTETGSDNKTVLILSDGGDFDEKTLRFAKERGIRIYAAGIGTAQGGVVPDYEGGKKQGFIKDETGSAVVSRLNTSFLRQLAEENGGAYYEVNNLQDDFPRFFTDIRSLDRSAVREERVRRYEKYFQVPLLLGLLLITAAFFLRGRTKDET